MGVGARDLGLQGFGVWGSRLQGLGRLFPEQEYSNVSPAVAIRILYPIKYVSLALQVPESTV